MIRVQRPGMSRIALRGGSSALSLAAFVAAKVALAATCTVPGDFTAIQDAINSTSAPNCRTIFVAPGTYLESLTIDHAITLYGANAGVDARVRKGNNESVITGSPAITITSGNVIVDGFTITSPDPGGYGIFAKGAANHIEVRNNIFDDIANSAATAQAIYLHSDPTTDGPDRAVITHNVMKNISGLNSTKGILIGDSNASDPSTRIFIAENKFTNITSSAKGAYGVQLGNGAAVSGGNSNVDLVIQNNEFSNLSGNWTHAVGLEGKTPNVIVAGNTFSNLTSAGINTVAVWFEDNPSFSTATVVQNNFNVGRHSTFFGIAVDPSLSGAPLNGTCNYWGNFTGPGYMGPGHGALVSDNVTYYPWRKTPAPSAGGNGLSSFASGFLGGLDAACTP